MILQVKSHGKNTELQSKDSAQLRFMNTLRMKKIQVKQNFKLMLKTAYIANVAQSKCLRNT